MGLNYNLNTLSYVTSPVITKLGETPRSMHDDRHTTRHIVQGVVAQLEPLVTLGLTQFLHILLFDISGVQGTL